MPDAGGVDLEGSAEVFHALGAGEGGLVTGGADAVERLEHGQAGVGGEHPGDFLGLVEIPVLIAPAVQGHGNQRPFSGERRCEPGIGKGLGPETPEVLGEVEFAGVFQAVDHAKRAVVPDHRRAGELEGEFQMAAVRATERAIDLALEHLAAVFAKRLGKAG